jgi:hypothetical protein
VGCIASTSGISSIGWDSWVRCIGCDRNNFDDIDDVEITSMISMISMMKLTTWPAGMGGKFRGGAKKKHISGSNQRPFAYEANALPLKAKVAIQVLRLSYQ